MVWTPSTASACQSEGVASRSALFCSSVDRRTPCHCRSARSLPASWARSALPQRAFLCTRGCTFLISRHYGTRLVGCAGKAKAPPEGGSGRGLAPQGCVSKPKPRREQDGTHTLTECCRSIPSEKRDYGTVLGRACRPERTRLVGQAGWRGRLLPLSVNCAAWVIRPAGEAHA
jgi:hypothetical protein